MVAGDFTRTALVTLHVPLQPQGIDLAYSDRQQRIAAQLGVVIEIVIAQGNTP